MESVVICLDNSIPMNDEELSILEYQEDLRQQFMVTEVICKQIWRSNRSNRVGIVKLAPFGDVVQQLTTESNLVIKALANIGLEEGMQFINGLKRAFVTLSQSWTIRKRLIIFVKNLINCSNKQLNDLPEKIPRSFVFMESNCLNIDVISIGNKVNENRSKLEIIESLFEVNVLNFHEVEKTDQKSILSVLSGSRVLEVTPSDLEDTLKLICGNYGQQHKTSLALRNNIENSLEKRINEIHSQKQAINNDKGVDPQTRDFILQTLDNELKAVFAPGEVSNKSSSVKLSEPTDDDDIMKAIQNSLKENYKKDSVKGLVDGLCNAFKEQNNQKTIENNDKQKTNSIKQKPKRVIRKFREKTKY